MVCPWCGGLDHRLCACPPFVEFVVATNPQMAIDRATIQLRQVRQTQNGGSWYVIEKEATEIRRGLYRVDYDWRQCDLTLDK